MSGEGPAPADGANPGPRHRRPALLDPSSMAGFGAERLDPAVITQVAHETAAVLVRTGRAAADPAVTARLITLVDEIGLDTVADLWADRPARSLPGALWRLYVLREWVQRDAAGASADYREGMMYADVAAVVAGAASPPGPDQMRALADAILRGVFDGDLAVALDRAAAFCKVVGSGRASAHGTTDVKRGLSLLTMAQDLAACARLWRSDDLV